ncbi:putative cell surface [Golovinomyces cichoracearum]|uniref:Putative cell surface n=1 Tax=Golovinomyces cichoracearum TaxID=62708 RepID=A0A420IJZ3_9PEZI|nr:putative cell surface [Golovinomyces cichoracearum]
MSSTVNKIKDALHINNDNEHATGKNNSTTKHYGNTHNSVPGSSLGAHGIERANPANPRLDSNLNPSNYERSAAVIDPKIHTGTSAGNEYTPGTGLGQNLNSSYYPDFDSTVSGQYPNANQARESQTGHTNVPGGSHSSTVGPHENDFLNKIDPRVQYNPSGHGNNHGRNPGGFYDKSRVNDTTGLGIGPQPSRSANPPSLDVE